MYIKNNQRLYDMGLTLVEGCSHLEQLVKNHKSVVWRINTNDIQVIPASWFLNYNYSVASSIIKHCLYVYDKNKFTHGLQ